MSALAGHLRPRDLLRSFGLVIAFALICIALSLMSNRFLTFGNISNVLRISAINAVISVGMTFVILTAGIDLSVGSVAALSAVIAAAAVQRFEFSIAAIVIGLLVGLIVGAINGALTITLRIPPFITTLGMLTIARGLALVFTAGQPITGFPDDFRFLGAGSLGPIPMPIIVAGLVFLLGFFVLTRTTVGSDILALGNNPMAARLSGIHTNRIIVIVYAVTGLLAGLAGILLIGRLDSAAPTLGVGYEFDSITAVVVGGTSLFGGEGGMGGTLLGVLIIGVINNGLNLLNVNALWEQVVKGVVIALALLIYERTRS